jgi:hypothetical protein
MFVLWVIWYILIIDLVYTHNWSDLFWLIFFFFLVVVGFELRALCLQCGHSTALDSPPVHFAVVTLETRISWTICPGWLWTTILLILVSQVTRITGMSHQYLTSFYNYYLLNIHEKFKIFENFCVNITRNKQIENKIS